MRPCAPEDDVDELPKLGEALAQGCNAALVREVGQGHDIKAHVVNAQHVHSLDLKKQKQHAQKKTKYGVHHFELQSGGVDQGGNQTLDSCVTLGDRSRRQCATRVTRTSRTSRTTLPLHLNSEFQSLHETISVGHEEVSKRTEPTIQQKKKNCCQVYHTKTAISGITEKRTQNPRKTNNEQNERKTKKRKNKKQDTQKKRLLIPSLLHDVRRPNR